MNRNRSCGYIAFLRLCQECKVEESIIRSFKEQVPYTDETTFLDFMQWAKIIGVEGRCIYSDKVDIIVPCIAHISCLHYQHFVVIVDYNKYVTYYDIDGKKHKVLQFLFNKVFTGYLFHMSVLKVL